MAERTTAAVEPIMELNTTPLIDVMLVLIIMLIIIIPPQTHRIAMDLPQGPPPLERNATSNALGLSRTGEASWNGVPASDAQIESTLAATATMEPSPELHFRPDSEARYERVDELLAMTKRANVTKMGFVGNERYQRF